MFKPYQLREHQKVMYKEAHSHNVHVEKEADGGRATNKGGGTQRSIRAAWRRMSALSMDGKRLK